MLLNYFSVLSVYYLGGYSSTRLFITSVFFFNFYTSDETIGVVRIFSLMSQRSSILADISQYSQWKRLWVDLLSKAYLIIYLLLNHFPCQNHWYTAICLLLFDFRTIQGDLTYDLIPTLIPENFFTFKFLTTDSYTLFSLLYRSAILYNYLSKYISKLCIIWYTLYSVVTSKAALSILTCII